MDILVILTGFAVGFFIELVQMRLTEKIVWSLLRSDSLKGKFIFIN